MKTSSVYYRNGSLVVPDVTPTAAAAQAAPATNNCCQRKQHLQQTTVALRQISYINQQTGQLAYRAAEVSAVIVEADVPKLKREIVHKLHDADYAGHPGAECTAMHCVLRMVKTSCFPTVET